MNIKSIEKKVSALNLLIERANNLDLEVVDESCTWQAPYKYEPIKYSRGTMYIKWVKLDLYKHLKKGINVWEKGSETIKKSDIQYACPINDLARMYRKALKRYETYGY